ncbi:hypothetical protein AAFP30_11060 [Gordonia sp. CPCC 205515]|uniref:hypothetical protein n=1 Tax=Gordonia sp. CPCC 205515 TaxID=3140791 RepID=UPI003AF37A84
MTDEPDATTQTPNDPDAESLLALWAAGRYDTEAAWAEAARDDAHIIGPSADELTARLSTVPGWFLTDPISVTALAGDVLGDTAVHRATVDVARTIDIRGTERARTVAGLALWLWASEDVVGPYHRPLRRDRCAPALAAFAFRLAATVTPLDLIGIAERREEAARTLLLWSGQRPAGESTDTARSLLDARDSLTRNAQLSAALADHEHRLAVARELEAARAREAAARPGPE